MRVCERRMPVIVSDYRSLSLDNSSGDNISTVEEAHNGLATDEEIGAVSTSTIAAEESAAEKIEYWSIAYVKHLILEAI